MRVHGLLVCVTVASTIGLQIRALAREKATSPSITSAAVTLPVEGELPSLDGAILWLNSDPVA